MKKLLKKVFGVLNTSRRPAARSATFRNQIGLECLETRLTPTVALVPKPIVVTFAPVGQTAAPATPPAPVSKFGTTGKGTTTTTSPTTGDSLKPGGEYEVKLYTKDQPTQTVPPKSMPVPVKLP